jgi:hypothetical protein
MDTELALDMMPAKDDVQFTRDGGTARFRKYIFYLGKHGPFTERVPMEPTFDENEIGRRIAALRSHLRTVQML